MRLALIGNCAYQALVDDSAAVRWLCWPRFDSSFVLGSLLDDDRGGELSVQPSAAASSEQAYLPSTNILRTVFECEDGSFEVIDFAPRFRRGSSSYMPTMLVRIVRPIEGTPRVRIRCRPVYDYGEAVLVGQVLGDRIQWLGERAALQLRTNVPSHIGADAFLLEQDVYLAFSWGEALEGGLEETCEQLLSRTKAYWQAWVKQMVLPGCFQSEVIRSALVLKLHQFEETGAITAAATTSLVEYPGSSRTWDYRYCWLRDAFFTLDALARLDHHEESERFASFLESLPAIGLPATGLPATGRLQPVYGIGGEQQLPETILEHLSGHLGEGPVRLGNAACAQIQNDVYGETIAAVAPLLLGRADCPPAALALLVRLLEQIDRTMELPDAGLWEIRDEPKLHTFSLLMHWLGATNAASVGARIDDAALEQRGRELAARARGLIEDRCFRPELGYYADSASTDHADAALLLMINLGFLEPEHPAAASHLASLHERLGLGNSLMQRYRHHDGIGETHATFTVCGFWYAEALARVGRAEEAERCFVDLLGYANHLGLFSEDIDPKTGKQWGNFPQTYSHAGLITAALAIQDQIRH